MIYYIGTGFLFGIMTLMDEGTELALGFHAANNLFIVPNGYNEELFNTDEENSESKYIDKSKFNFIYVGNSQWRKGLDVLMNSWKVAFKKFDNATLTIKDNPKIYGQSNILNEIIFEFQSKIFRILAI